MTARIFLLLLAALLQSTAQKAHGAKILGLFPDMSRSHVGQYRPLFRALAAQGHHVTVLSGFPEHKPVTNCRDIVIEGIEETARRLLYFPAMAAITEAEVLFNKLRFGVNFKEVMEQTFTTNGTQTLLKSTESFDLIFVDITISLFYLGFVHKFGNPPFIGVVPYGINMLADSFVGNPDNPSYVPSEFMPLTDRMTFYERFMQAVEYFSSKLFIHYDNLPNIDRHMRAHFGADVPSAWKISQNMSLLMVNRDIAHDFPRPLTPATIEVGGMHLQPAKPLPEELQRFLDGAAAGAIFFSLGSVVRSDQLSAVQLRTILDAFRALPQRVLWKWEAAALADLPPNVLVKKWLPQNDVLAHPNVKLFITHGGISSLEEAIYQRVPMIVIPVFGDQFYQAGKIVARGMGVKVDYQRLSEGLLFDAILEVQGNSSYAESVSRINRISRDKLQPPLQTALFWSEYVLRHGGAQHLRSAALAVPWHRYLLLDVLAGYLLAVVAALAAVVAAVRRIAKLCARVAAPRKRAHRASPSIYVMTKDHKQY